MDRADKPDFWDGMADIAGRFPNVKWDDIGPSYWHVLQFFELANVLAAAEDAVRGQIFFPSAEVIREQALRIERSLKRQKETTSVEQPVADLSHVPSGEEEQAEYINAATTVPERLARQYECESKRLALSPSRPSPRELSKRRAEDIQKLVGDIKKKWGTDG